MSVSVEFIPGPSITDFSRTAADGALQRHPAIRKGASYALEQMDGRWVAAIVHTAGPPPFGGGGPADAEEEAPGLKSEGPDDTEPSEGGEPKLPKSDDGGDSDGDSDGPPKAKGDHGGGVEHQLLDLVQQIAEALGLPVGLGGDPLADAGPDGAPGPVGPGGPPGIPAPGGPPHQDGPASTQHVVHERVTKPGETPPGGTPIGTPAFASVRADHPWAHLAGKVASFQVADQIGNTPITEIESELRSLASEVGYKVARLREDLDNQGNRVAAALITRH